MISSKPGTPAPGWRTPKNNAEMERKAGMSGTDTRVDERLFKRDFVMICLVNMLAFFSIYLVIPILPVFLEERGYSNSLVGAIMSMATVAALLRPLFGRFADLRGRKATLLGGTLVMGISTFLYAAFSTALPLFLIRFLNGLGLAAFHTAAYAVIGDLAPAARRLQAIAFFYISVDVTIAAAPIAAKAMEDSLGYSPVYALAGGLAVLAFIASLLVRETHEAREPEAREKRRLRLTPLQRNIYLATMGFTLTFGTLQTFIVLSSESKGVVQGELFFTVFAVTLIVFRLGVGRRADRWGRRNLILSSAAITLVGLGTLSFSSTLFQLLLGSFLYALGFAYLPTTLSALLLDHTDAADRGAALGIFMAVFDLGIGLGGIALGPLADLWGYTPMYLSGGAIAIACLVPFLARAVTTRESKPG
ncbi:MAG: MFS transporter [Actinobacteria bacterium]|nr:MFS transporter [Actinomycetota bacterium]